MANEENPRVDIGKLIPRYEPLRPVLEALAEQYAVLPTDLTELSAAGGSGDPYTRVTMTLLLRNDPDHIDPARLRERAAMMNATAERLERERVTYNDQTLIKVRRVLAKTMGFGTKPEGAVVTDIISALQNEGILFRERA